MRVSRQLARRLRAQEPPSSPPAGVRAPLDQAPARLALSTSPAPMNGEEARYAELLELRRQAGEIAWWGFEAWSLRLAHAWYTPDFVVVLPRGSVEMHEWKGHWRESARVRIKVAASLYPFLRFLAIRRGRRRGHAYDIEEIQPRPVGPWIHHAIRGER